MIYSREDVYGTVGQQDKVACFSFVIGSETKAKYGSYVVGKVVYTPKERKEMRTNYYSQQNFRTDGLVKIELLGISELNKSLKSELKETGIPVTEISNIEYFSHNFNAVSHDEKGFKELPKPIEIEFYHPSNRKYELTDFALPILPKNALNNPRHEWIKSMVHDKIVKEAMISFEEFMSNRGIEPQDKTWKEVQYGYLMDRYMNESLSEGEKNVLDALISERNKKRLNLIKKEFGLGKGKGNSDTSQLASENMKRIVVNTLFFETNTLLFGKFLVWWDVERFIHITARHMAETQIGEKNIATKSIVPYRLKDLVKLIQSILSELEHDIVAHFSIEKEKDFTSLARECFACAVNQTT